MYLFKSLMMKVAAYLLFALSFMHLIICVETIPVIFIHTGDSAYLEHTLWQAREYNEQVILLGDTSNNHYSHLKIEHYCSASYSQAANYFASIYKHISPMPYNFELTCFQRWFILEEFMQSKSIPVVFHCDTDAMLYCNITQEYEYFKNYDLALVFIKRYHFINNYQGGMFSFWNLKSITSFCNYIRSVYENKEKINALLKNYSAQQPSTYYHDDYPVTMDFVMNSTADLKITSINKILNEALFDNLMWLDYHMEEDSKKIEFLMKDIVLQNCVYSKIKDIIWINNQPYCYSRSLKKYLRFKALHFQDACKVLIKQFRRQKNQ